MHRLRAFLALPVFLWLATHSSPARATFSIVAADKATGAIGSAGASCVPYEVIRILRVAEGKGLLVGQANFDDDALAKGQSMLSAGEEPASVLSTITDAALFPAAPKMQYGIVDIAGRTASITGTQASPYAGDMAGLSGDIAFTVQGNILTGPEVLEQMSAAVAEGCDLPERLVRALEAAGAKGGGDSRCTEDGISAASAYVVAEQGGMTMVHISLPDLRPNDPVAALRGELEKWRVEHPCPPEQQGPGNDPGADPEASSGCAQSTGKPSLPGGLLVGAMAAAVLLRRRSRGVDSRHRRSASPADCHVAPGPA